MKKQNQKWIVIGLIILLVVTMQPAKKETFPDITFLHAYEVLGGWRADTDPSTYDADWVLRLWKTGAPGETDTGQLGNTLTMGEYTISTQADANIPNMDCLPYPSGLTGLTNIQVIYTDTDGCDHYSYDWRGGSSCDCSCNAQSDYDGGFHAVCVNTCEPISTCTVTGQAFITEPDYGGLYEAGRLYGQCYWKTTISKPGMPDYVTDWNSAQNEVWDDGNLKIIFNTERVADKPDGYDTSWWQCVRMINTYDYKIPTDSITTDFQHEKIIIENNWKPVFAQIKIDEESIDETISLPTGITEYDFSATAPYNPSVAIKLSNAEFSNFNNPCYLDGTLYPWTECEYLTIQTFNGDTYVTTTTSTTTTSTTQAPTTTQIGATTTTLDTTTSTSQTATTEEGTTTTLDGGDKDGDNFLLIIMGALGFIIFLSIMKKK